MIPKDRSVGPYKILSHLATGGMGEVYLAQDERLGRKVVLKILPERFTRDPDRIKRFMQEARATSALNHPNILTVYDVGNVESIHYIANEFIEGETLRHHLSRGRLKIEEVVDIAIQSSRALIAAHDSGILHRDIKPDNIMVRSDGLVKILDFGLAKLIQPQPHSPDDWKTETGVVMGTPNHMSPEQARGEEVDARTDLFALGIVMYEMIAGKSPFPGANLAEILLAIVNAEPRRLSEDAPELPFELERIVSKLLRKNRADRYQSARELLSDLLIFQRNIQIPLTQIPTQAPAARKELRAIAVLPFRPISPDDRDEYLELGIADALITKLSDIREIVVRPTSAIRRYMELDQDATAAGRELAVESVLEGSIRRSGNSIRITARLLRVADGRSLWAGKFDENFTDIFTVEDSISEKVAASLALKLSNEEKERLTRRYTENVEAYHLYLKGRYYCNKRSAEGLNKSVECFRQALEIEPNYAPAYAGLADAYIYLGDAGITAVPAREAFTKGKAAAAKALEIDNTLAETHSSLAHLHMHAFDWIEAEKEFHRSFELKQNYAGAHQIYAFYLLFMGRLAEAAAEIEHALELDPLSVPINADKASIAFYSRHYDQAIGLYLKTIEMDPHAIGVRLHLARAYEQKGFFEKALEQYEMAVSLSNRSTGSIASLAHTYALMGKEVEARALLAELYDVSIRKYASPYDLAVLHAGLGETDRALEWLNKGYTERSEWIIYLSVDPRLAILHADGRFLHLIQQIGLVLLPQN